VWTLMLQAQSRQSKADHCLPRGDTEAEMLILRNQTAETLETFRQESALAMFRSLAIQWLRDHQGLVVPNQILHMLRHCCHLRKQAVFYRTRPWTALGQELMDYKLF
jgi:hypothetical protein